MIMIIRDMKGVVRGMIDLPTRDEGNRVTRQELEIRAGLRGAGWTMAPPEDRTAGVLLASPPARTRLGESGQAVDRGELPGDLAHSYLAPRDGA